MDRGEGSRWPAAAAQRVSLRLLGDASLASTYLELSLQALICHCERAAWLIEKKKGREGELGSSSCIVVVSHFAEQWRCHVVGPIYFRPSSSRSSYLWPRRRGSASWLAIHHYHQSARQHHTNTNSYTQEPIAPTHRITSVVSAVVLVMPAPYASATAVRLRHSHRRRNQTNHSTN